ncbi:gliding motility-associated C-terminal domain-containing protein [Larkinella sp. VNQ87]|uniref:T9SS type B sorting domain-containing protein n=1 Tax=Larkinella sp. VNQ87 TaxID=3400921 RepID=UPI003C0A4D84
MAGSDARLLIPFLLLTALLTRSLVGFAQTCTGTLGEPIINETFGNRIATPLEPGQTTYRFVSDRCPGDGEYIVVHSTECYATSWHPITEDHTPGDQNGTMLVVNASFEPGEFYSKSVSGLCSGITYEFSVWVMNLMSPMQTDGCNAIEPVPLNPNITMTIARTDGRPLQMFTTGSIGRSASPTWLRYSILFTMPPAENTVVVKLINQGPGGCGNDLALDDIQFRPCHPALGIAYEGTEQTSLEICQNSSQWLQSELGAGYTNPVYQWQESEDGSTWQNLPNATNATYRLVATYTGQRFYRLLSTESPNVLSDPDSHCRSVSNTVSLTVLSPEECTSPRVFIPDVFTPNDDGINDDLSLYLDETLTFEFRLFNRWGSVMFSTTSRELTWDGTFRDKPCPEGIYTWEITYRSSDVTREVKNYRKTGQVLLQR